MGIPLMRAALAPAEVRTIGGLRVTSPARAVVDEVIRADELRAAVRVIDMTLGAEPLTRDDLSTYRCSMARRAGASRVDQALRLAVEDSWSPGETSSRLVWVLDGHLPPPLCNVRLVADDGLHLGRPDPLDPESGLCIEYDGIWHRRELAGPPSRHHP